MSPHAMLTEALPRVPQASAPRPLRVALLATVTAFGGIEQVVLTLLRHAARDIELFPILFTRQDADQGSFFTLLEELNVPQATFVNGRKRRFVNMVRNTRDALHLFKTRQFDVLHTHGYRADMLGLLISKRHRVPAVATVHGFTPNDQYLRLYQRLDVMLLRRFDRVVAVSGSMKHELVARGVTASRIEVVTNAVVAPPTTGRTPAALAIRQRLGLTDDDVVFGYVGRLSREKGPDTLFQALRLVNVPRGRVYLVLVGDGEERARLEDSVRALGLAHSVSFAGFHTDPGPWYSAMDAFVLPSLTEGTPMALLEAMAHGLPIIASAVGGVPAVISSGDNGLLVPAADPQRLAEAMRAVAVQSKLRERLSTNARSSVRRDFSVESWMQKMAAVYRAAALRAVRA